MTGKRPTGAPDGDTEPRGWVIRLGSYLHIFGKPASGTMGFRTSGVYGPPGGAETYLDSLVRMAQRRESELRAPGTGADREPV